MNSACCESVFFQSGQFSSSTSETPPSHKRPPAHSESPFPSTCLLYILTRDPSSFGGRQRGCWPKTYGTLLPWLRPAPFFPVASLSVCSRRPGLGPAVARLECAGVRGAGRGRGARGAEKRTRQTVLFCFGSRGAECAPKSPIPGPLPRHPFSPIPVAGRVGRGAPNPESAGGSRNGTRKMSPRATPELRSATPSFPSFSPSHPPAAEGPRGKEATGAVRVGAGGAEAGPSARASGLLGAAGGPRGPSSVGSV